MGIQWKDTKILQWTNKIWPISGNKMKGSCSRVSGSDFNFSSVVTFLCLLLLSDRIRSQKQKISLSLQGRNSEFLKKPWEWLRKSNIILIGIHWLDCLWLAFPFFFKGSNREKGSETDIKRHIYIYSSENRKKLKWVHIREYWAEAVNAT